MNIFECKVFFEDTDAGQVVYHANYLKYCDRARTEWMRSMGVSFVELLKDNRSTFVVMDISMKFRKPAILGDVLQVQSVIASVGRVGVMFEQKVINKKTEVVLCEVKTRCAFVSGEQTKPTRMPQEYIDKLNKEVSTQ